MSDVSQGGALRDETPTVLPGGFRAVARVEELEAGVTFAVETDGLRLCLARVGDEVFAFDDQCTHREFPLSAGEILPDGIIECPWHGAKFDCRTGAVCAGPAREPVAVYDVRIHDGVVHVRVRP